MAYSTEADLAKLLPENVLINLSNDSAGATTINPTNMGEMIDQADREIDSYCAIAGYEVPFATVPPLIANLSAKMAIWNLHLRKYFNSEIWRQTYEDCLRILTRIAEGKLVISPTTEGEAETYGGYDYSSRRQKFSRRTWRTF